MHSYHKLKEVLVYNERENKGIYIPNEIFDDFTDIFKIRPSSHLSFAYSYYYLISYLYRFTKYNDNNHFEVPRLKEILGYSPLNKTIDVIIKKDGLLDQAGYTEKSNDRPLYWTFTTTGYIDNRAVSPNELTFIYESEWLEEQDDGYRAWHWTEFGSRRNRSFKVPVKGLHRTHWSRQREEWDGTFFEVHNTTMIPVEAFLHCMSIKELGVEGFWIYSFIKYMAEYFGGHYDVPLHSLAQQTQVSQHKVSQVLKSLEAHRMIWNDHKTFVVGRPQGFKTEACSYGIIDSGFFSLTEVNTSRREIMSFERYAKLNAIDIEKYTAVPTKQQEIAEAK